MYDMYLLIYILISPIHSTNTYYLVAIIDNDFISGDKDGSQFRLLTSLLEVGSEASKD